MRIRTVLISSTALAFSAGLSFAPAMAQTATASAADAAVEEAARGSLDDIVVTARRSSENLQTVPVAVTALNNASLERKQVLVVTDLQRSAPSLSVGTGGTGPASIVYLAIRGQAQNSPNSVSDASVGIYIDGVYVARPIVGNLGFLDIASAEVLRGPQGTLFGRNTTGGALNITSNQPVDRFEGLVKVGYGNFQSKQIEGMINVPLGDELAVRFAGRYNDHDGYFPNPTFGQKQGEVKNDYFFRATIKWSPKSVPLTFTLTGDYSLYNDNGNATAVSAINPASPLAAFTATSIGVQNGTIAPGAPGPFGIPAGAFANFAKPGTDPTLRSYVNPEFTSTPAPGTDWRQTFGGPRTGNPEIDNLFNRTLARSVGGTLDWDLDGVKVKSITAYRQSRAADSLDLTGTPTSGGAFVSEYFNRQFSQELQLSGKAGNLDWIGGFYYFREAGSERSDSAVFYNSPIGSFARNLTDYTAQSTGLFAQLNYHVTDSLRVTGGLRYTWDARSIDRHAVRDWRKAPADQVCNVGVNRGLTAAAAPCTDPRKAQFSYPAWLASVDYKLNDDVFIYLKTSGASMSGGFNTRPVPAPFPDAFQPEQVKDIELGFKGEFLERRVRVNAAAFHAWQSKVQRIVNAVIPPNTLTQFSTNAGDVRTYGFEVEATVLPWEGMELQGSAAYLHARYRPGSRFESQLVNGQIVTVDRTGEAVTQAPEWTANIGATQSFDLGGGRLSLHADYAYIADRAFDVFTTGNPAQAAAVAIANQASIIKSYGLLSGRIAFTLEQPNIEFAVWGKNLTNQAFFTNVFNSYTGIGAVLQFQGAPRTFGGTVAFKF